MTAISQRPQLRFVSYDAEWKVTKIADEIESIDSGWSPQCGNQPATDSEWGILKTTSVVWEGYNEVANKRLSDGLSPRKQTEVQAHDILVTRAGPTDRVGVVVYVNETRPKLMLSDKIIRLRCYERNNSNFVAKYLGSRRAQSYLWRRKSGIATSQTNISQSDLKSVPITLPSLPEQKKIADFLTSVDDRIGQLIKKKALLEDYKKGVMQQLFSQQIRFKDDNGNDFPDWEEKKLGEVCRIKTGKKDVNEGNPDGQYPFFTCAKRHTYSDSYSFDTTAILIAGNGEVGHCVFYKGKFEAYQRTYVLSDFKRSVDYIFPYLNFFFRHTVDQQKQMGAMPYIKLGMLTDFPIPIPSDPQEQTKIANFVAALDRNIESVSQQIAKTQTFKKGLLQQMFV